MISIKRVEVAVFAAFITLQVSGYANGGDKNKNYKPDKDDCVRTESEMDVRVTIYNDKERHCDRGTLNKDSATGVKLRVAAPGIIGTASTDPAILPPGTRVDVTLKDGSTLSYLCVDSGGAVVSKKASRVLAKQEHRGKEWATRPVIDIFSYRAVTSDWATVRVIKDRPLAGLKGSKKLARLEERMCVNYWKPGRQEQFGQCTELLAKNK